MVGAFDVLVGLSELLVALLLDGSLEAASLDEAELDGSVMLEAAEPAGASLDEAWLAGAMLEDIELEDIALEDIALEDIELDEALGVDAGDAVPLVELHPASRTAAPVSAAIKVVRFIGAPSGRCRCHW